MFPLPTPVEPPEVDQARRTLAYLDRSLLPGLSGERHAEYLRCRQSATRPALTRRMRLFPGGPVMPGAPATVPGGGDSAYGLSRLEMVLEKVVIPMIADGSLPEEKTREILERLRGGLAGLYRKVEQARRAQGIHNAKETP